MADNVVSISGKDIVAPAEPVPAVVACLEKYLEMARSGEIQGVQIVAGCFDRSTYGSFEGLMNYSMLGRFECLKSDVIDFLKS